MCQLCLYTSLRWKQKSRESLKARYLPVLASFKIFRHYKEFLCVCVCVSKPSEVPLKQWGARPQVVFLFLSPFTLNHPVVSPFTALQLVYNSALSISPHLPVPVFPHPDSEASLTFCSPNSDTVANLFYYLSHLFFSFCLSSQTPSVYVFSHLSEIHSHDLLEKLIHTRLRNTMCDFKKADSGIFPIA